MKKKCSKCKLIKDFNEFYNSKRAKSGKRPECKLCTNNDNLQRYNLEEKRNLALKSYYKNKDVNLLKQREKYANDEEYKKQCNIKNKKNNSLKGSEYYKRWYEKNRETKLLKNKEYSEKREKIDPEYKLRRRLRSRLTTALRKYKIISDKERNIERLIGCNLNHLKNHLENMFRDNMTWDNHGKIWHIDHIIPCCNFNLLDLGEQTKCFHYTNLQPLLIKENLKKGGKTNYDIHHFPQ